MASPTIPDGARMPVISLPPPIPIGRTTIRTYDAVSLLLTVIDALGRVTWYTYDSL